MIRVRSHSPDSEPIVPPLTGEPLSAPIAGRADLEARLVEAEETLRAIRAGEVDALVVHDATPDAQVFTLSSADRPYRMFVENMRDGAATLSESGVVLYANQALAGLAARPLAQLIGAPIKSLFAPGTVDALRTIGGLPGGTAELDLISDRGDSVPVRISTSELDVGARPVLCVTFTDLSQQNAHKAEIDRMQVERLTELERTQDALTEQATHDSLTGLANRSLLMDRIGQALGVAARSQQAIGLIFVDVDGFKEINDTRGHAAGDSVLRQIAERLQSVVRPMDSVARLGGDEFVVLLPALARLGDAAAVAARIASAISLPLKLDHGSATLTASIGISVEDPHQPGYEPNADRLLQDADTAMYHAKSLGGDKTERFEIGVTPSMREAHRETWIARIREGLDENRFLLHAQPIVDLATGSVTQHELLLRLLDRNGVLVAPLDFLPTAERCGLIDEIDRWAVTQAIAIAARGRPAAVNVSGQSAGDPVLLDLIEREIDRLHVDPNNLVFEITETAVMQNTERGRLFAERLVALGCHFALDDFGTGFSSFIYLKHLPAQYLKIDIEFVRDLTTSRRDRSVVSAIVALARGFGLQTIAEGVEDQDTAYALSALGVNFAQGYLFGAPAPLPAHFLESGQLTGQPAELQQARRTGLALSAQAPRKP